MNRTPYLPPAGRAPIFGVHYLASADAGCPAWPTYSDYCRCGTGNKPRPNPVNRPAVYAAHLRCGPVWSEVRRDGQVIHRFEFGPEA